MDRLQRMQRELMGTYDELRNAKARLAEKLSSAQTRLSFLEQAGGATAATAAALPAPLQRGGSSTPLDEAVELLSGREEADVVQPSPNELLAQQLRLRDQRIRELESVLRDSGPQQRGDEAAPGSADSALRRGVSERLAALGNNGNWLPAPLKCATGTSSSSAPGTGGVTDEAIHKASASAVPVGGLDAGDSSEAYAADAAVEGLAATAASVPLLPAPDGAVAALPTTPEVAAELAMPRPAGSAGGSAGGDSATGGPQAVAGTCVSMRDEEDVANSEDTTPRLAAAAVLRLGDEEATPRLMGALHMREAPPTWCVEQSFELALPGGESPRLPHDVQLLNRSTTASVRKAVEALNTGVIACPARFCVVYSASARAYFALYRSGSRQAALARLCPAESVAEAIATSDSASAPADAPSGASSEGGRKDTTPEKLRPRLGTSSVLPKEQLAAGAKPATHPPTAPSTAAPPPMAAGAVEAAAASVAERRCWVDTPKVDEELMAGPVGSMTSIASSASGPPPSMVLREGPLTVEFLDSTGATPATHQDAELWSLFAATSGAVTQAPATGSQQARAPPPAMEKADRRSPAVVHFTPFLPTAPTGDDSCPLAAAVGESVASDTHGGSGESAPFAAEEPMAPRTREFGASASATAPATMSAPAACRVIEEPPEMQALNSAESGGTAVVDEVGQLHYDAGGSGIEDAQEQARHAAALAGLRTAVEAMYQQVEAPEQRAAGTEAHHMANPALLPTGTLLQPPLVFRRASAPTTAPTAPAGVPEQRRRFSPFSRGVPEVGVGKVVRSRSEQRPEVASQAVATPTLPPQERHGPSLQAGIASPSLRQHRLKAATTSQPRARPTATNVGGSCSGLLPQGPPGNTTPTPPQALLQPLLSATSAPFGAVPAVTMPPPNKSMPAASLPAAVATLSMLLPPAPSGAPTTPPVPQAQALSELVAGYLPRYASPVLRRAAAPTVVVSPLRQRSGSARSRQAGDVQLSVPAARSTSPRRRSPSRGHRSPQPRTPTPGSPPAGVGLATVGSQMSATASPVPSGPMQGDFAGRGVRMAQPPTMRRHRSEPGLSLGQLGWATAGVRHRGTASPAPGYGGSSSSTSSGRAPFTGPTAAVPTGASGHRSGWQAPGVLAAGVAPGPAGIAAPVVIPALPAGIASGTAKGPSLPSAAPTPPTPGSSAAAPSEQSGAIGAQRLGTCIQYTTTTVAGEVNSMDGSNLALGGAPWLTGACSLEATVGFGAGGRRIHCQPPPRATPTPLHRLGSRSRAASRTESPALSDRGSIPPMLRGGAVVITPPGAPAAAGAAGIAAAATAVAPGAMERGGRFRMEAEGGGGSGGRGSGSDDDGRRGGGRRGGVPTTAEIAAAAVSAGSATTAAGTNQQLLSAATPAAVAAAVDVARGDALGCMKVAAAPDELSAAEHQQHLLPQPHHPPHVMTPPIPTQVPLA